MTAISKKLNINKFPNTVKEYNNTITVHWTNNGKLVIVKADRYIDVSVRLNIKKT